MGDQKLPPGRALHRHANKITNTTKSMIIPENDSVGVQLRSPADKPEMLNLILRMSSNYCFPTVPLPCLLLDSPSSSLAPTRSPFVNVNAEHWGWDIRHHYCPLWQAIPHLTSAFTQTHLRVEHQLRLSLHLPKIGSWSVVLSWAATTCKVIFLCGAGVGISKSIVDRSGINSEVENFDRVCNTSFG